MTSGVMCIRKVDSRIRQRIKGSKMMICDELESESTLWEAVPLANRLGRGRPSIGCKDGG
jgi:hypothetical protein